MHTVYLQFQLVTTCTGQQTKKSLLLQKRIQMVPRNSSLRTRIEHDSLGVVNDHRRPGHNVSDLKLLQKENRGINPSEALEIYLVCPVSILLHLNGFRFEGLEFFKYTGSKSVKRFADSSDLSTNPSFSERCQKD
jgi:hypothetical protein